MQPINRRTLLGSGLTLVASASTGTGDDKTAANSKESAPAKRAAPLAQEYVAVHHNPDRERYIEGPGLVKLDDGALVAVVPVVPRGQWSEARRATTSRTHIVRSDDAGVTWRQVSELPYYSAVPWLHRGKLYLFANKGGTKVRNDDLLLLRSDDGGATWSEPVTLFTGHFWNCHTGMVVRDDRLYWAIDDLAAGPRGPCLIAGDLSRDPMDPKAWRISKPVPFFGVPQELINPKFGKPRGMYLEPNVIEVRGRLQVLLAVKPNNQSTANLVAVFDALDDGEKLELRFVQYSPMLGGQLKFCVLYDDVSKMFWATANLVVDSQGRYDFYKPKEGKYRGLANGGNDRRFLMLLYGLDGVNWFQAGCIARATEIGKSFMYARPVIDGDDLAVISRSSVDAPDNHDADFATFHRVRNFRDLAMNLYPDSYDPS